MAMWDWFLSLFNKETKTLTLDAFIGELTGEIFFKELAVQACINLIANTLSRSEFLTYEKGKEVKKDNYYLFNVEPNPNKSASKFWRDVVSRLVYDNECLVIQQGVHFYVADSFSVQKFAFKEYLYENIVIDNYTLRNVYNESQVFHFELHDQKIRDVIEGINNSYAKLITASQQHYKRNNAKRGTLEIPTNYPQTDKAQKDLQDLLNNRIKRFYEAEGGAVLPLSNGMKYEELQSNTVSKGSVEGRDIREFINDVFDFVAIAFQVPTQLIKSDIADTEKAVKNFLTFCINPLAELLMDEINRKLYGKRLFLERTYLRIDTTRIKSVDIKDIAGALETLLRIGAYTIDDCLKALGLEPLGTDWSQTRFMTKNYETIQDRIAAGGG